MPEIVQDWENLHDEDRRVFSRLNNFFCGLHSLVHIAQTANKALTETENKYFDSNVPILNKQFSKKTESGTTRLIRTACKTFSYHGDEKCGCHGPFMTFIKEFLEEKVTDSMFCFTMQVWCICSERKWCNFSKVLDPTSGFCMT